MNHRPIKGQRDIDTEYHYIQDIMKKGEIQVDYVPSEENPADIFYESTELGSTSLLRSWNEPPALISSISISNSTSDFQISAEIMRTRILRIYNFDKKGFFTEYAILQRISHHSFEYL